ncbi:hypothetical protein [Endozoicomonas sp. SESOKO1]|nr:hypothetical protein [Endozoicomonas sp. SESOKO1]
MVLADFMERQVERMFAPIKEEGHEHFPSHYDSMHEAFERAEQNQFD